MVLVCWSESRSTHTFSYLSRGSSSSERELDIHKKLWSEVRGLKPWCGCSTLWLAQHWHPGTQLAFIGILKWDKEGVVFRRGHPLSCSECQHQLCTDFSHCCLRRTLLGYFLYVLGIALCVWGQKDNFWVKGWANPSNCCTCVTER